MIISLIVIKLNATQKINKLKYIICKNSEIFENPKGFKGKIACPNYYDICDSTSLCNNLFDCLNKKSKTLEESYDYNKKEEIVDSNNSNQIFTVKSMESSWISCFKITNNYVIYLYGDFSKEVKILDKVTIELTTSKAEKKKQYVLPLINLVLLKNVSNAILIFVNIL